MDSPVATNDEANVARNIVKHIADGNARAETQLVARYSRGLGYLLNRLTSNSDLANDLQQDVFQLVIVKIRQGEIRDPTKLAAYIQQIARNLCIEYYRKDKRRRENLEKNQYVDENRIANPDDSLAQQQDVDNVRTIINALPNARDKELLYRFHVLEQDKDTICDELDLDHIHFNRVIYRARNRFKQLWLEKSK